MSNKYLLLGRKAKRFSNSLLLSPPYLFMWKDEKEFSPRFGVREEREKEEEGKVFLIRRFFSFLCSILLVQIT